MDSQTPGAAVLAAMARINRTWLERRPQDPDQTGTPARERSGDRVRLVPELVGHTAHTLLGLGRHLDAAQRVGDSRRRQTGGIRYLPDRHALAGGAHQQLRLTRERPGLDKNPLNRFT